MDTNLQKINTANNELKRIEDSFDFDERYVTSICLFPDNEVSFSLFTPDNHQESLTFRLNKQQTLTCTRKGTLAHEQTRFEQHIKQWAGL